MTIIADPEERQALEALCDWLATKCAWPPNEAPAQNACIILQDALTKPAKPDGLREACLILVKAHTEWQEQMAGCDFDDPISDAVKEIQRILDADSSRRNAEVNRPAFPNGCFASREKGGV